MYICVVLDHDIKYTCIVIVKNDWKSVSNTTQFYQTGSVVVLSRDKEKTNPFSKSLRTKYISKFILFYISERCLLVYDVI